VEKAARNQRLRPRSRPFLRKPHIWRLTRARRRIVNPSVVRSSASAWRWRRA